MAVPVIEEYTEQSDTNPSTTITLSKPPGVQVGELLLLICINDETDGSAFSDNKSGWNFLGEFGDTTSDSIIGIFWKIAEGNELSSEDVTQDGSDEWVAWYVRISGVNTSNPINVIGTANTGLGNSITAPAVTTDVNDCLALCFGGFDGGDGYSFTVSGTGWSKEDDGQSGTSGYSDASGVWGKKSIASAGSTLDATIGASASDGMVGVQIAIAPSGGVSYELQAEGGNYTETGQTAALLKGSLIGIETGAFNEIGQIVNLLKDSVIDINVGSYVETGQNAGLFKGSVVGAGTGTYTLTGQDVTLIYGGGGYEMTAESGSYGLSGQNANVLWNKRLNIESESFEIFGYEIEKKKVLVIG